MRRTAIAVGLTFACLMTAFAPAAGACPGERRAAASQPADQAGQAVICLVNQRRAHNGLRRLSGNPALAASGQAHSIAMDTGDFFSHDGPDGGLQARAAAAGYPGGSNDWWVGEDLGYGQNKAGSPRAMVAAWMRSPEHRKVMLERFWRQIGVGISDGSPLGTNESGFATYSLEFGYNHG